MFIGIINWSICRLSLPFGTFHYLPFLFIPFPLSLPLPYIHSHTSTFSHTLTNSSVHTHILSHTHSHMQALSLGHIGFFPIQNLMRALSCSTMELAVLEPIHNFRFANRFITLQRKKSAQFSCQIKKLGVKYFLRMKKPRLWRAEATKARRQNFEGL